MRRSVNFRHPLSPIRQLTQLSSLKRSSSRDYNRKDKLNNLMNESSLYQVMVRRVGLIGDLKTYTGSCEGVHWWPKDAHRKLRGCSLVTYRRTQEVERVFIGDLKTHTGSWEGVHWWIISHGWTWYYFSGQANTKWNSSFCSQKAYFLLLFSTSFYFQLMGKRPQYWQYKHSLCGIQSKQFSQLNSALNAIYRETLFHIAYYTTVTYMSVYIASCCFTRLYKYSTEGFCDLYLDNRNTSHAMVITSVKIHIGIFKSVTLKT